MDQEQRVLDIILNQTDTRYHAEMEQCLPPGFLEFLRTTPKITVMEQIYNPHKIVNIPNTYSIWQKCLAVSRIIYNSSSRSHKKRFEILARQTLRDLRYVTMEGMRDDLKRELFVLDDADFSGPTTSTVTIPRCELSIQDRKGDELEKRLDALLEYKIKCPCPVGSCCSKEEMTSFRELVVHLDSIHPVCSLFACSYCQLGFSSYGELREHNCEGDNSKEMCFCRTMLACLGCGQHFTLNVRNTNEDDWKQFCHFMINHNSSKMQLIRVYSSAQFGVCATIRLQFLPAYAKHLKSHCAQCDVPIGSVLDLRDHCHSEEKICCGLPFRTKIDLLRHFGQKHFHKSFQLAEYLRGAESRTFYGISTTSNKNCKSPAKLDLPTETDSFKKLINALRGLSEGKLAKVNVFSSDKPSKIVGFLKKGFKLQRVLQTIPDSDLADDVCNQFQEEAHLTLEPLIEHQRQINCFKRTTFCLGCRLITNSNDAHLPDCQALQSDGKTDYGTNMVNVLLEENSLPNTVIPCPTEHCDERCCSFNGLLYHLALQHNIKAILKLENDLGAEYPVTDIAFTNKVNLACFLTEGGEFPEERILEPTEEANMNRSIVLEQAKMNFTDDVITIDDDDDESPVISEFSPPAKRRKFEETADDVRDNKENKIDKIISSVVAMRSQALTTMEQNEAEILGQLASLDKTCPYCGLYFTDDEYLGQHLLSHPEFSTDCKICKVVFRTFMDLFEHQEKTHLLLPDGPREVDQFFLCTFCSTSLPRSAMFSHQIYECRNVSNCGICGCAQKSQRSSTEAWAMHMIEHHRNEFGRFRCVCQRSFSHFSIFVQHICQNPSPQLQSAQLTWMIEHLDYERLGYAQAVLQSLSGGCESQNGSLISIIPELRIRKRPAPPHFLKRTSNHSQSDGALPSPLSDTRSEPAQSPSVSALVQSAELAQKEDFLCPPETVQIIDRPASCASANQNLPSTVSSAIPEWTAADDSDEIMVFSEMIYEERNFKCTYCSRKFLTEKQLKRHMADDHRHDCKDILCEKDYGLPKTGNFFICHREATAFATLEHFKQHNETHKDETNECPHCTIITINRVALEKHLESGKNTIFMCLRCKPHMKFKEEWLLYEHLRNSHRADLVYYCKGCKLATCDSEDPNLFFHIKYNWCGKLKTCDELCSANTGICPASDITFQPENVEEYDKKVKESPDDFTTPTACSHRSFARHADHFTTCPEIHYPGSEKCFGLVPQLRYVNILQSLANGGEISNDLIFANAVYLVDPPCPYKRIQKGIDTGSATVESTGASGSGGTPANSIPPRRIRRNRTVEKAPSPTATALILQPVRVFTEKELQIVQNAIQTGRVNPGGPTVTPPQISRLKEILASQSRIAPAQPQLGMVSQKNIPSANKRAAMVASPAMSQGVSESVQTLSAVRNSSMPPPVSRPVQPPVNAARTRLTVVQNQMQQGRAQPIINPQTIAEALNREFAAQQTAIVQGQGRAPAQQRQMPQQQPNPTMIAPNYHQYPAGPRGVQMQQQMIVNALQAQQAQNQQIQYQVVQVPRHGYQVQTQGSTGQQFDTPANHHQRQAPAGTSMQIQPWPHRLHCSVCGTRFTNEDEVLQHMGNQHGLNPAQNVTFKLKCPLVDHCCNNTVFDDVQKFRKHINTAHADKFAYHSSDCGSRFHTQEKAQQHESHHSEEDVGCCYLCGKNGGWKNYAEKKKHYLIHCLTSPMHFGCTICRGNFQSEAYFFQHFDVVHGDLPNDILRARENFKFSVFCMPNNFELKLTPIFLYYLGL